MDVEMAILECDGELSVLPKSQHRAVTPSDLGLETSYEGPTHTLVIDGEIDYGALEAIGLMNSGCADNWPKEVSVTSARYCWL